MAGCDDTRQLTEDQRQAGYQQQRTGVMQAVRPFSGRPTLENLLDYINRELYPAVKQTRAKVNDIYLPVVDNAPSGNPLTYYFDTNTANADPTTGRVRLNASPQRTGTVLRVSETNARLVSSLPWLDVMSGGATSPLGVITLADANDPRRFIRYDLDGMTDQGSYWDLAVTPIEWSHDNPFVNGTGLQIAFVPGVGGATAATVPATSLGTIPGNTVLGNPTFFAAAPTPVAVGSNTVLGRTSGGMVAAQVITEQIADGAVTTIKIADVNVTTAKIANDAVTDTKIRNSAGMSVIGRAANTTGDPADITATAAYQYLRVNQAGTGLIWTAFAFASMPTMADSTFLGNITGGTTTPQVTSLSGLASTSIVYDATTHTFQRAALSGGDLSGAQNVNSFTIVNDAVTDAKLRNSSGLSVIGRVGNTTGDPADIIGSGALQHLRVNAAGTSLEWATITLASLPSQATDTVLGNISGSSSTPVAVPLSSLASTSISYDGTSHTFQRAALTGDVTASLNANATTIANNAVTDAKLRDSAGLSVIGRSGNTTGDPADIIAAAGPLSYLRTNSAGTALVFSNVTLTSLPTQAADTFLGNITTGTTTPVAVNLSSLASTSLGYDATSHTFQRAAFTGDVTAAQNTNALTIANDAVTDVKLRNSTGLSVIGRAGNTTGDPGDIAASTPLTYLRLNGAGTSLEWGVLPAVSLPSQATETVLGNVSGTTATPVAVTLSSLGSTSLIYDATSHSFQRAAFTGDVTASQNANALTIANDAVTNAKLANMAASTVKGQTVGGSGDPVDLTATQLNAVVGSADLTLSNALMLGTSQLVSSAPPHTITLAANATRLFFLTGTPGTLVSLTGATAGRLVYVQPVGAALTVQHTSGSASGIVCPGGVDFTCRVRDGFFLVGDGGNGWLVAGAPVAAIFDGDKGDITVSSSGATWTIDNDVVTNAKLRDSSALSVIGRSANSSGDPGDIAGSAALQHLRVNAAGTALEWGTLTLASLPSQASDTFLGNISGGGSAPVAVNLSSLASTSLLYDATSHTWQRPAFTGDVTAAQNANALTIANDAVTNAKLANVAVGTVKGLQIDAAGTGDPVDLTGLEVGELLRMGTAQSVSIAATTNDQTLNADTTVLRITPTGNQTLTGMTGGVTGRVVFVENVAGSGNNLTLSSLGAGSLTANRFRTPNGVDMVLRFRESAIARFDNVNGDWRIIATARATAVVDGTYGDIVVSGAASTWTVGNDAITDAKLRNSGALSVIGRSANSSGDPADISAVAASGAVLRESGSTIGFGTIATAGIANNAVTNAKLRQSAALSVIGNATNASADPADIAAANDGEVLRRSGTAVGFGTVATAGIGDNAVTTIKILDANVTNPKLANMAPATIKGRALGAGTGVPTDLTQTQVGDMLRLNTLSDITIAPGTQNDYAVTEATKLLRITVNATGVLFITGILLGTDNSGGWIRLFNNSTTTTRTIQLVHDSASSSVNNRFFLPDGSDFILERRGEAVDLQYIGGRWQVVSTLVTTNRIVPGAVTNSKLRDSTGYSVMGRSVSSSGPPSDILATVDGQVLRFDATATSLGFGTVATAGIADAAVTNAKLRDSTALSVVGRAGGTNGAPADIVANSVTNAGMPLKVNNAGTSLAWGTVDTVGIADQAVTNPKLAFVGAGTVKGRASGVGTGAPTDLTGTQVTDIIQSSLESRVLTFSAGPQNFLAGIYCTNTVQLDNSASLTGTSWNDAAVGAVAIAKFNPTVSPGLLGGIDRTGNGQMLWVINSSTVNDLQILGNSAGSSAGNRFLMGTTSMTLAPLRAMGFWYDSANTRWRPLAPY